MTTCDPDGAATTTDLRTRARAWLAAHPGAVFDEEPDPTGLIGELQVHQAELEVQNEELRRAQLELERSRQQYADLFDLAPVGYLILDEAGTILRANRTAARMAGAVVGGSGYLLLHHDDREALFLLLRSALAAPQGRVGTAEARLAEEEDSAEVVHVRLDAGVLPAEETRYRVTLTDITERWLRDAEREAARELLQTTIDGVDEPILVIGLDHRVKLMNRAAREFHGVSVDAGGRAPTCYQVSHGSDRPCSECGEECPLVEMRSAPRAHRMIHDHRTPDGQRRVMEIIASPLFDHAGVLTGFIECSRDVTERLRMEAELQRARRLESLGVLAGGIAHDFNNLLAVLQGNIDFAWGRSEQGPEVQAALSDARVAFGQAKELTGQLLTFSRGGAPVREAASLPELVQDSARFAASGSPVRCDLSFPADLWPVAVDRGQFSQVVHNLVLNAVQAMPRGGEVRVSARNLDGAATDAAATLPPGRYVRLRVEDDGPGIPADVLDQVFDPYFTTKDGGTGLGLASVYSIVSRHGGAIEVTSPPGRGARFDVWVPASATPVVAPPAPIAAPPVERAPARILVMDDNAAIREMLARLLDRLGHEVDTAADGAAALARYREAQDAGRRYDVVVLDLTVVGGMGGKETMRRLLELDPRARGIVSSGYSNDPVMAEPAAYGFSGVVTKPYSARVLAETVSRVLDSALPN